jgi:HSP20 family protein
MEDAMNQGQDVVTQDIPANVYRTDQRVMVAAPMPGLEPQDIAVSIGAGPSITLHGDMRGSLKGDKDVLLDEWTPGPYHRELALPADVDGERANVTYNNGVLVIVLPVAEHTQPAELKLEEISATHGARVGNQGRNAEDPSQQGAAEASTAYNSGETI